MKRLYPLLFISVLIYWSCEEPKEEVVEVILFSATFHEEYDPTVKSFVYISDSLGSVIADTSFYGSGSFVFSEKYTLGSAPKKIGVTAVTQNDGGISLVTNLGVDIGSDFNYYDPYMEISIIGQSSYSFINAPDNFNYFYITSKGHRSSVNNNSATLNHYYDNEDVIVMMFFNDGTADYLVVENVQIGSTNDVDLSNLQPGVNVTIPNNTGLPFNWSKADGYAAGDSYIDYNRLAKLTGAIKYDDENSNFIFNYPSTNITSNFRVNAYTGSGFDDPGGKIYRQTTTGSLPSSIEKIDADFDLISSDLDNFEISHSGSFDQWSVSLEDTSISAYWSVYNSSSSSTMILPSIPASVSDEYSSLSSPSFSYAHISLTDWMCAETFKEWIELFHSSNGYYLDFCSGFRRLTYWPEE